MARPGLRRTMSAMDVSTSYLLTADTASLSDDTISDISLDSFLMSRMDDVTTDDDSIDSEAMKISRRYRVRDPTFDPRKIVVDASFRRTKSTRNQKALTMEDIDVNNQTFFHTFESKEFMNESFRKSKNELWDPTKVSHNNVSAFFNQDQQHFISPSADRKEKKSNNSRCPRDKAREFEDVSHNLSSRHLDFSDVDCDPFLSGDDNDHTTSKRRRRKKSKKKEDPEYREVKGSGIDWDVVDAKAKQSLEAYRVAEGSIYPEISRTEAQKFRGSGNAWLEGRYSKNADWKRDASGMTLEVPCSPKIKEDSILLARPTGKTLVTDRIKNKPKQQIRTELVFTGSNSKQTENQEGSLHESQSQISYIHSQSTSKAEDPLTSLKNQSSTVKPTRRSLFSRTNSLPALSKANLFTRTFQRGFKDQEGVNECAGQVEVCELASDIGALRTLDGNSTNPLTSVSQDEHKSVESKANCTCNQESIRLKKDLVKDSVRGEKYAKERRTSGKHVTKVGDTRGKQDIVPSLTNPNQHDHVVKSPKVASKLDSASRISGAPRRSRSLESPQTRHALLTEKCIPSSPRESSDRGQDLWRSDSGNGRDFFVLELPTHKLKHVPGRSQSLCGDPNQESCHAKSLSRSPTPRHRCSSISGPVTNYEIGQEASEVANNSDNGKRSRLRGNSVDIGHTKQMEDGMDNGKKISRIDTLKTPKTRSDRDRRHGRLNRRRSQGHDSQESFHTSIEKDTMIDINPIVDISECSMDERDILMGRKRPSKSKRHSGKDSRSSSGSYAKDKKLKRKESERGSQRRNSPEGFELSAEISIDITELSMEDEDYTIDESRTSNSKRDSHLSRTGHDSRRRKNSVDEDSSKAPKNSGHQSTRDDSSEKHGSGSLRRQSKLDSSRHQSKSPGQCEEDRTELDSSTKKNHRHRRGDTSDLNQDDTYSKSLSKSSKCHRRTKSKPEDSRRRSKSPGPVEGNHKTKPEGIVESAVDRRVRSSTIRSFDDSIASASWNFSSGERKSIEEVRKSSKKSKRRDGRSMSAPKTSVTDVEGQKDESDPSKHEHKSHSHGRRRRSHSVPRSAEMVEDAKPKDAPPSESAVPRSRRRRRSLDLTSATITDGNSSIESRKDTATKEASEKPSKPSFLSRFASLDEEKGPKPSRRSQLSRTMSERFNASTTRTTKREEKSDPFRLPS